MERQMHQARTSVGSVQMINSVSSCLTVQSVHLPLSAPSISVFSFDLLSHFSTFLSLSLSLSP